MDLKKMLVGAIPGGKVFQAIEDNNVNDISDEDLEEFAGRILVPIKGRLEDLLAKPARKHFLENKPQFVSASDLEALDIESADRDTKMRVMAQAMMAHTGFAETYFGVSAVLDKVNRYYTGTPDVNRSTVAAYFGEPKNRRPGTWLHDAIQVGIWKIEGERKMRLLPMNEAAENARQFLIEFKSDPKARSEQGFEVDISDEEIKQEKESGC